MRRPAAALALFLAPLGLLMANAGYAWATRHGGSDKTGADLLALAWQHPRALRLSLAGGSLMIAGYACYLAVLSHDRVRRNRDRRAAAKGLVRAASRPCW